MPKNKGATKKTTTRGKSNKRRTSEAEIKEVFDSLGLSSYEQRAKYVVMNRDEKPKDSDRHYVIVLSNNSEPVRTAH